MNNASTSRSPPFGSDHSGTMEAVVIRRYGGPEVLEVTRVKTPTPGAGQVRVRVLATSINAADHRLMRASPFLARLSSGLFRPTKTPILGADVVGIVDAVGTGVGRFKVGDHVYGDTSNNGFGGFAEYVVVDEACLAFAPKGLPPAEAAAIPLAGITALQAVRDVAVVQPGQSVLVYGAGGSVGSFLVQLAKERGADVTAVCGAESMRIAADVGADRVLDRRRWCLADADETFDVIFGVNGRQPLATYRDRLRGGGVYVMVGGDNGQIFASLLWGAVSFAGSGRRHRILTVDNHRRAADLQALTAMVERGRLRVVVDRVYPRREAAAAMARVLAGEAKGKVVLC